MITKRYAVVQQKAPCDCFGCEQIAEVTLSLNGRLHLATLGV